MPPSHLQKLLEIKTTMVDLGLTGSAASKVMKIPRSTSYAIFSGKYKKGGLTASVIKRILTSQELPDKVRQKVIEYAHEKLAGTYGHHPKQTQRFKSQLENFINQGDTP